MADLRDRLQSTLGDAYTLERELGGGGMSRVFVASERRFRRPVVVKVLSAEMAAGVSAERFEREIQLAASLQQANIVPLLSAGETDGLPYYTMPFVDGESLRATLGARGRLPITDAVSILRDVARALSYAHAHGVVHRDIKPDNILLSHGAAVVTDFGIAKAISAARTGTDLHAGTLTQAGTSIGTPAYMAPEQVAGDTADSRADIYAFGCVAYEVLAGRPPFLGTSAQRLFASHLAEQPTAIQELRPEIPASLASLVMRCLAKEPAQRPASADEMLRALDAVTTPGVSSTMTPSSSQRSRLSARAWWVAALGAVAIAIAAGALWRSRTAGAPTSIAVLPLANLSGDPANDYFGEGLAEEMTGALAKAGLRVIGRGAARALVARGLDATEIARQLGVGTVLQGNVQRAGDRVRISVTLVNARDGAVMWNQTYDRQLADVFAVQDEIARTVARELHATLAGGAAVRLVHMETTDPEAHTLYLQGMYLWNRRTAPAIRQAISFFEQAVARDSTYARAYAGIALAYTVLPFYADVRTDSVEAEAQAAANRALAMDSTLAEAWTAKAYSLATLWKNIEAESVFAIAFRMDSTFAPAHYWRAITLQHLGLNSIAQQEFARAMMLEPTSLVIQAGSGMAAVSGRRFSDAMDIIQRALRFDSTYALARYQLATLYQAMGRNGDAIPILESLARTPSVRPSEVAAALALSYAAAGRTADARRVIASLTGPGGTLPPNGGLAAALWQLGDHQRALAVLRAAVTRYDPWVINYSKTPRFDALRSDPEGRRLLEQTERH